MIFWIAETTTTTIAVVVQSDTTGTVTGTLLGQRVQVAVDTTVNDGTGKLVFSNLAAGTKYTIDLFDTAGVRTVTEARTAPASGGKIMFLSCNSSDLGLPLNVGAMGGEVGVCIGDAFYAEGGRTRYDITSLGLDDSLAIGTDADNYYQWWKLFFRCSGRQWTRSKPMYFVVDDHEQAVDNLTDTLATWQSGTTYDIDAGAGWEANADSIMQAASAGMDAYLQGNPQTATQGSDTAPNYFKFTWGDAEVFVLACIVWSRETGSRRIRQTTTMLGSDQVAWLKAALAASTKKIKIIFSPKQTLPAQSTNNDAWEGETAWQTELDDILDTIEAASGWAVPGGVIWGTGDWHSPTAGAKFNGVDGATHDHVSVSACASGQDSDGARDSTGANTWTRFFLTGDDVQPNAAALDYWCFGQMEVASGGAYVDATIYRVKDLKPLWRGRVEAGSNALVSIPIKASA